MDRLVYTAMTGASQTMNRQAAIAHNLANVTSTGYKAEEHRLRAAQVLTESGSALPTRAFVVDASAYTDYSAGAMQYTGRNLDVAVQGKGWLVVTLPDGSEGYTRNGSLEISANGVLQTRAGYPVAGDGGSITIPPDSKIAIGADGTISVVNETGSQAAVNAVGKLKLVNPAQDSIVRGENGFFKMEDGSTAATDTTVTVAGSYLEASNVNSVEQMVAMISLSRQFEMQMKAITTAETNDKSATQIINAR